MSFATTGVTSYMRGTYNRKYVILDIDGVLTIPSTGHNPENGLRYVDQGCAGRMVELLTMTDADIVLSSTWKNLPGYQKLLEDNGCPMEIIDRISGYTHNMQCIDDPNDRRRREINHWIGTYLEPGDRYVVVDDMRGAWQGESFIKTSFGVGFTSECLEKAVRQLLRQVGG